MWRVAPLIILSLIFFGLSSARPYSGEQPTMMLAAPAAAFEDVRAGLPYQQASGQTELQNLENAVPQASTVTTEDGRGTLSRVPADPANNAPMRIYILYGQYWWATSSGMYYLAQSLVRYGEVSVHEWDDRTVVPEAKRHSGKVVIIGFSLGANTAVAIANKLPHADLIVAYDPSRLSPMVHVANGEFMQQVAPTVRRAICFYNPYAWYFGGARLEGSQVEIIPIVNYHLAVAVDQRLHEITEEAVRKVAVTTSVREAPAPFAASRPSTAAMKSEEPSMARMDMSREPIPVGRGQERSMPNTQRKISLP
jgi:hypothetical protein